MPRRVGGVSCGLSSSALCVVKSTVPFIERAISQTRPCDKPAHGLPPFLLCTGSRIGVWWHCPWFEPPRGLRFPTTGGKGTASTARHWPRRSPPRGYIGPYLMTTRRRARAARGAALRQREEPLTSWAIPQPHLRRNAVLRPVQPRLLRALTPLCEEVPDTACQAFK